MRRAQQKKILELLQTLHEAHRELEGLFSQGAYPAAVQVLADCQAFAVSVGNYIESIASPGTATVSLLEEYCALLYEASVAANGQKASRASAKPLKKMLARAEGSVRSELRPDRLEVAFFPYKASMFDSMESIWAAASADAQCDAYVVPIPYYDRLPGGELGQMHDEAALYPAQVPVVSWQSYDVAERRPDIIFVHAPYDEGNRVTSVHPDFYCERLRALTDLLVYVPYFVHDKAVPVHFCLLPGVLHAHQVVLQSEAVRQTYARIYGAYEKAKGQAGRADGKFAALGSPKFDKALHAKREDFTLPESWARLLEGPGGEKPCVVLYNTNVSGMLEGNRQALEKLRFVFETFRARRDVVLWWRPHPLNMETFRTMRPQLAAQYEEMAALYRREGWGIYDDSPDLDRAIAFSDAYYGDASSLVPLFECVGKPVMLQEMRLTPDAPAWGALPVGSLLWAEGRLWASFYGALFTVDPPTGQTKFVGNFPENGLPQPQRYHAAVACGGSLYFAPGTAQGLGRYHLETGAFQEISFKRDGKQPPQAFAFRSIFSHEGDVFIVGGRVPEIVRHRPQAGETARCAQLRPLLSAKPAEGERNWNWLGTACQNGNLVVAPVWHEDAVVVFDMDSSVAKVHPVGGGTKGYSAACFDGRHYWLAPRQGGRVVRWAPDSGACTVYDVGDVGVESAPAGAAPEYTAIASFAGHIWLFPGRTGRAVKIDAATGQASLAAGFDSPQDSIVDAHTGQYSLACTAEDRLYAYSPMLRALVCGDAHGGPAAPLYARLAPGAAGHLAPFRAQLYRDIQKNSLSMYDASAMESTLLDLDSYLAYAVQHAAAPKALSPSAAIHPGDISNPGTAGAEIFAHCRDLVFKGGPL
ncbi:MAG: hypothetical protein AB7V55_00325 [Oscillospiraceae bacterium]